MIRPAVNILMNLCISYRSLSCSQGSFDLCRTQLHWHRAHPLRPVAGRRGCCSQGIGNPWGRPTEDPLICKTLSHSICTTCAVLFIYYTRTQSIVPKWKNHITLCLIVSISCNINFKILRMGQNRTWLAGHQNGGREPRSSWCGGWLWPKQQQDAHS